MAIGNITDEIVNQLKDMDEGASLYEQGEHIFDTKGMAGDHFGKAIISNYMKDGSTANIPESVKKTYEDYSLVKNRINTIMSEDPIGFTENPEFKNLRVYQDKLAHDMNAELKMFDPVSKIAPGQPGNTRGDYSYSIKWGEADRSIQESFDMDLANLRKMAATSMPTE